MNVYMCKPSSAHDGTLLTYLIVTIRFCSSSSWGSSSFWASTCSWASLSDPALDFAWFCESPESLKRWGVGGRPLVPGAPGSLTSQAVWATCYVVETLVSL